MHFAYAAPQRHAIASLYAADYTHRAAFRRFRPCGKALARL